MFPVGINIWTESHIFISNFVELGGGVGDVPVWSRGEAYVEFGFR